MQLRTCCAAIAILFALAGASSAHEHFFTATLNGENQSPANGSPGTAIVDVTLDLDILDLRLDVVFNGLSSPITGAAIHAATAVPGSGITGVAVPVPGFPTGGTSGMYDQTFSIAVPSSYDPTFIAASGGTTSDALNAFVFSLEDGKAYLNIYTTGFPNGEIRGFLTEVPEPVDGDFDGDGDVDGADFVAWQTNFPKPNGATLAQGDADSDGDVDGADFVVWQTHFPFPAHAGSTAVPEPSAIFLCLVGVIVTAIVARRGLNK
jgi:hypothetical protein